MIWRLIIIEGLFFIVRKSSDTLKIVYSYRNIAWIYEIKQNL